MTHALRPGVSFCRIGDVALFLDAPGDRYFRLPPPLNQTVLALAEGKDGDPAGLASLTSAGVLVASEDGLPIQPVRHAVPPTANPAIAEGPFRLGDVAGVMLAQRRVERRLRNSKLALVLDDLGRRRSDCVNDTQALRGRAARIVRAFEYARLLRSAANRCLPRSIALAKCLAREGIQADVVLAVKLAPFAAHCWTEVGGTVVNDTSEEVARYTPILVA